MGKKILSVHFGEEKNSRKFNVAAQDSVGKGKKNVDNWDSTIKKKTPVLYWQNINGGPNKTLRLQGIKESLRGFRKSITIIGNIKRL